MKHSGIAFSLTMVACLMHGLQAVPLSEFFPFGTAAGDQRFPPNDDSSTSALPLPQIFPYFNNNHREIYLANNGLFSFLGPVSQFVPDPFPLNDGRRLVAAFWSDIDTRGYIPSGNIVSYQIYQNNDNSSAVFEKATSYVQRYFPSERAFNPTMVITGTWYRVGAYSMRTSLTNTFQIVLATDQLRSFAFLLYHELQWASPSSSVNLVNPGEIGGQAGFDAGDGIVFQMLPYSRTSYVRLLANISNVNVPGLFIFRIDTDTITIGGCGNESDLVFRPRRGSQLGGTPLIIQGPCFSNMSEGNVQCRFGDSIVVNATIISDIKAICLTPAMPLPEMVFVYLSIDAGHTFQVFPSTFSYTRADHGLSTTGDAQVSLVNQTTSIISPGDQITLEWFLSDTSIDNWPNETVRLEVQMWTVRLNTSNNGITPNGFVVLQVNMTPVTGYQSMSVNVPSSNTDEMSIIYFRIAAIDHVSRVIYAGLNSPLFILSRITTASNSYCVNWLRRQPDPTTWNDNLFPCPMTLSQARVARCCYEPDPLCREDLNSSLNCVARRGRVNYEEESAVACYISRSSNGEGAGSECCYGSSGQLITRGTGGGTDDRYHPTIYPILHFFEDTLPFVACCLATSDREACAQYFYFRPHRRGSNSPNSWGGTWGDPHFTTLDGSSYTFNGHGEYTYLAIANASVPTNAAFDANVQSLIFNAQIRTTPLPGTSSTSAGAATVIRGLAAKSNHLLAEPMSITVSRRELLIVRRGNETLDLDATNDDTTQNSDAFTLFYPEVTLEFNRTSKTITLSWLIGVSIQITPISVNRSGSTILLLNVGVSVAGVHQHRVFGLLGLYDGNRNNDLRALNGSIFGPADTLTLEQIHRSFGQTWAINATSSLFYYENGDSASVYASQNRVYTPSFVPPQPSATLVNAALSACNIPSSATNQSTWTLAQQTCYYDIAVTNDVSLGQVSRSVAETIAQIANDQRSPPEFNLNLPLVMTVNASDNVTIDFTAVSQYSSTIRYTLVHGPSSARFNNENAVFSWTAQVDPSNNTIIRVSAQDAVHNLVSTHEVVLHFASRSANSSVIISGASCSHQSIKIIFIFVFLTLQMI